MPRVPLSHAAGPPPDARAAETIHVIDADEAARHSLCLLLSVQGLPSRAYASAQDFLAAAGPSDRGCVIADPGPASGDLIRELRARGSGMPVIVVTGSGNVTAAVAAMRAGAADLFEKPFDGDALLRSVYRALDAQRGATAVHRAARLTARESQVIDRVAKGASTAAIARELGISPRTVDIHRASVMAKLDVSSTAELLRAWRRRGASLGGTRPPPSG